MLFLFISGEYPAFLFEGVQDTPPEDAKRNIQPYNPHTNDTHSHHHHTTPSTSHHHYPEHRRSLDNSNIRLTSQRSPPQDRQSLPSQRSPPQEPISHQWSPPQDVTSRSAPSSQRSPPQDSSSSSRSQKSPSHRSPPQDEVLHYQYRVSMNKETELPLTSSYSINDFTHSSYKYTPSALPQYKSPLSSGKTNSYGVHHHQHSPHPPQQQSSSGNPPSSKHKLKGQDMYGLHSNKTQTHSSKSQTHPSKSHSHSSSSGLSKLQSMRSYSTKEGAHRGGGGGGEGGGHPLSVSHSSPQHKTKYS